MKKIILFVCLLLIPSITSAFDFSDIQAKKVFCEQGENNTGNVYDAEADTCTEIHTMMSIDGSFTNKTVNSFHYFYCTNDGSNYGYSYVTESCLELGDTYLYKVGNTKYPIGLDEKWQHYRDLVDETTAGERGDFVSISLQKKLAKAYKQYLKKVENKNELETTVYSEQLTNKIEDIIPSIKNEKVKNALFLFKYEIENYYMRNIYGCKGEYCNKWGEYTDDSYRKKVQLKDDAELFIESGDPATFGCYNGKTILKKNGREKIIIDDVEYSKGYSLCSVNAQVVDNDNVRLFVCIEGGAGSGECGSLVFNLNLDTEKLSFIGNWYYVPETGFDMYILQAYKKQRKGELQEAKEDIIKALGQNKKSEEYIREIKYLQTMKETHKKIRNYFLKEHNLEIPYIEGDELIELLPKK